MPTARTLALTAAAMVAFAGNSVLCRLALTTTSIDPASFTLARVLSGAVFLCLVLAWRRKTLLGAGSWPAAALLLTYAGCFSFAYITLPTAVGALLLFGAVQVAMLGYGLARGERLASWQGLGLLCALSGFIVLLLPGLSAPPLQGALLMLAAGVAWAAYSLLGRGNTDPVGASAGNFLRAAPLALALYLATRSGMPMDYHGLAYAMASGALASGAGYAIWYAALPGLTASSAATVQLSVPLLAAVAGVAWLGEPVTARLLLVCALILGGIFLVITRGEAGPNHR